MVKLASSPYGIWLYSYVNHSNSDARRIKRVRGQRLRLDLAERICQWGLASYRIACVPTVVPLQLLAHHTTCQTCLGPARQRARKSAPCASPAVTRNSAMPGQKPGVSAQRKASISDRPESTVSPYSRQAKPRPVSRCTAHRAKVSKVMNPMAMSTTSGVW